MNDFSAQNFGSFTAKNILGNGVSKINHNGQWIKVETSSVFDKIVISQRPWEMTQDQWMKQQNTGTEFIDPEHYSPYQIDEKDLAEFPILVATENFRGKTIEFRSRDESLRYVDHDDNDEILRDEQGMAIYIDDARAEEMDLPAKDETIHFFDGNKRIGHIGDSWGATELFVADDYQRMGIGTYVLKMYMKMHPTRQHKPRILGQMTPAGDSMTRKLHRQLVEDAINNKDNVPSQVLQDYGLTDKPMSCRFC